MVENEIKAIVGDVDPAAIEYVKSDNVQLFLYAASQADPKPEELADLFEVVAKMAFNQGLQHGREESLKHARVGLPS